MDTTNTTAQSLSDDLARALASVQAQTSAPVAQATTPDPTVSSSDSDLKFEDFDTLPVPPAMPQPASNPTAQDSPSPVVTSPSDAGSDLDSIKIAALKELRPLMGNLDLSPEERFEKYLMMLRATDDKALIPDTFSAAKAIADEKLKAQALLDVINEINYLNTVSAA